MENIIPDSLHNRDLRNFGFFIAGAMMVWWLYNTILKDKILSVYFLFIPFTLVIIAIAVPRLLFYPYRGWMWFGERMGTVMSKVILSLFFFCILSPIAYLRRFFLKDPLQLQWERDRKSYFQDKKIEPSSQLERMF